MPHARRRWISLALAVPMLLLSSTASADDYESSQAGHPLRIAAYIPYICWQIVVANLQVAWLILHPRMPIKPGLVRARADQQPAIGQVIHAKSITITPGTITLDVRDGEILVHALNEAFGDADASGDLNRRVSRIEDGLS